MSAAQAAGLLEGTNLSPSEEVSRYDVATVISNALAAWQIAGEDLEAVQGQIGDYGSIPKEYRPSVANFYALELVSGKDSAGRFYGTDKLTLAEGCMLLSQLLPVVHKEWRTSYLQYTLWQSGSENRRLFIGLCTDYIPLPIEEAAESDPELSLSSFMQHPGYWQRLSWSGVEVDCFHFSKDNPWLKLSNDVEVLYHIQITMPGIETFHGICVGSTAEEVLAAYSVFGWIGPTDEASTVFSHISEGYLGSFSPDFKFTMENGVVTAIKMNYYYPAGWPLT